MKIFRTSTKFKKWKNLIWKDDAGKSHSTGRIIQYSWTPSIKQFSSVKILNYFYVFHILHRCLFHAILLIALSHWKTILMRRWTVLILIPLQSVFLVDTTHLAVTVFHKKLWIKPFFLILLMIWIAWKRKRSLNLIRNTCKL